MIIRNCFHATMYIWAAIVAGALLAAFQCSPPAYSADVFGADDTAQSANSVQPYRLGPDDEINIRVINWSKFDTQTVVGPDGAISVPLLSIINVNGMSAGDLEQALTAGWSQYIVHPSVSVSLIHKREQRDVLLYGGLNKSGLIHYQPNLDLLQAIAEMGGPTNQGDMSNVTIIHGENKRVVDLSKPAASPEVVLSPGDVIFVPTVQNKISVLGEVLRPGNVDYPGNTSLNVLDALTAVGGVTPSADLAHAEFTHGGKTTTLDLDALLHHGNMATNLSLVSGDSIFIPLDGLQVYVFGDINKPGFYVIHSGDRVLDAIKLAGGPATEADLGKAVLIHVDKAKNTALVSKIDIGNFITRGDLTQNVLLQANDNIFIPMKNRPFQLLDALGVLTSLGLAVGSVHSLSGGL